MGKLNTDIVDNGFETLPLDDQFNILLHKKLLSKTGSAKRFTKKYYKDKYKKTGIIPKSLLLVKEHIFEGRRASGRKSSLSDNVKKRFKEMVIASSDVNDTNFIFVTSQARKISVFHDCLENEFKHKISISALRRYAKRANLTYYLTKDDFSDDNVEQYYFEPRPVFDLIQVDGCNLRYIRIKNENNEWKKPVIIEFYDTGSRYMFVLDVYFSESNENSIDLFSKFLLSTPFPDKPIYIRPDNAKGFLNLKRPIHELNLKYSIMPDRFKLNPDFSRIRHPKDKVHLESSHRSLHNFEILIIKRFEDKIVEKRPEYIFSGNKKAKITITYLDIGIDNLIQSGIIDQYRRKHNENVHYFSERGMVTKFAPQDKLSDYMSKVTTIEFKSKHIKNFMKYGFAKKKATVTREKKIRYNNQNYYVVECAYKFSSHKSTLVKISEVNNKLLIFEDKTDGIFIGEALPLECKSKLKSKLTKPNKAIEDNEVERMTRYLESRGMSVKMNTLIDEYNKGLTLEKIIKVCELNGKYYDQLAEEIKDKSKTAFALFNAFIMDCMRYQNNKKGGNLN